MARKEGIRKLFDNIAPDYDRLNHILSLNIDKGWMKVLDVACGTADFTIEIAQKVAPGSEVIGVDISEGMMAIGREKIKKAGLTAELSVPSNSFIRWCYKLYFLKILPATGGLISGNRGAYEYLPASVLRFPAPEQFIQMMKDAGFNTVEHTPFTLGICRMYIGRKSAR